MIAAEAWPTETWEWVAFFGLGVPIFVLAMIVITVELLDAYQAWNGTRRDRRDVSVNLMRARRVATDAHRKMDEITYSSFIQMVEHAEKQAR